MTGRRKVALARMLAWASWWLVAGCSVGSQVEGRRVTGAAIDPRVPSPHVVASQGEASVAELSGEPDTTDNAAMVVLSIGPPRIERIATAFEAVDDCRAWQLTKDDAEQLFAMSHAVDPRTYLGYGEAPCTITGTVRSDGVEWQFTINGAAKATWRRGNEVRFLGCEERRCEEFGV